jgi:hypothetical protein
MSYCPNKQKLKTGPAGVSAKCDAVSGSYQWRSRQCNCTSTGLPLADGVTTYRRGKAPHTTQHLLQDTLNRLQDWERLSGFRLSKTKKKSISLARAERRKQETQLFLYNSHIETVDELPILGLT